MLLGPLPDDRKRIDRSPGRRLAVRVGRRTSVYVVVSYDVADDRRRSRVAKCLEGHGRRVQFSVFDCLLDEKTLLDLRTRLSALIDMECDSVRFYRLCARCRTVIDVLGAGTVQEEQDVIVV
jgi:CRISPR-associated protein Cas2